MKKDIRESLINVMGWLLLVIVTAGAIFFGSDTYAASNLKNASLKSDNSPKANYRKYKVIVDAGHGGFDPGFATKGGIYEKDINLSIALKTKKELEKKGFIVILTRDTDKDVATEETNKKTSDMRHRIEMINDGNDLCVSIHQNSYTSGEVRGAQVFYYKNSKEGKRLAEIITDKFLEEVDPENHRKSKENSSYYILKKSQCPSVIIECGFLSNWEEANNLSDELYQEKIAKAITESIIMYFTEKKQ